MKDRKLKKTQKKGDEKEMKKSEKGITLIALIITIIILVILVAVSVQTITNMGIVGHAINGTQDYARGAKAENEMLDETGRLIERTVGSLKEIQQGNSNTSGSNPTVVINHDIYDQLPIGSYIYYRPSGEYTWQAKYYATSNDYDDKRLASGKRYDELCTAYYDRIDEYESELYGLEEEENYDAYNELYAEYEEFKSGYDPDEPYKDFTINVWRIVSKDDNTGMIELVPENIENCPDVILQGAQGYNNGVKLLNDACSALYKDASKGITARSINIEDLKSKMTQEALIRAQYYPYETKEQAEERDESNGDKPVYGTSWTTAYSEPGGNDVYRDETGAFVYFKKYPVMYGLEAGRNINGIPSANGLSQSEQETFIERNSGTSTTTNIGVITTDEKIKPINTYQMLDIGYMYDASTPYVSAYCGTWVASRYVNLLSSYGDRAKFGLFMLYVDDGSELVTSDVYLLDSNGYGSEGIDEKLYPVISMDYSLIGFDEEDEIHLMTNY